MSDPHDKLTEQLRRGGWHAADHDVLESWLKEQVHAVHRSEKSLHPTIQELKDMIDNDGDMYMGFNRMLEGDPVVKDYNVLLKTMNRFLTRAPYYDR
ncbi:hypothetical protein EST38_g12562 [Candolleomyces aberdarensis]|uniref:L-tryptophan decarboxylase PsiD-like domain-containing protein n=1 Tax=Candolleomyces aberdarensis TaxID=2316362 RepID=A0A4Q2D388_9AGAR|nr:hypothetical protein EST38_g12562 [Candolleomyces aberdarensis]